MFFKLFSDNIFKSYGQNFNLQIHLIRNDNINQIKNKDWEDIAADDQHFYIADTGNNFGTRENLRIYILNRNFIPEGTISISYKKQTTFSKEPLNEFDAEGLTVFGDKLALFSKNRTSLIRSSPILEENNS